MCRCKVHCVSRACLGCVGLADKANRNVGSNAASAPVPGCLRKSFGPAIIGKREAFLHVF